MAERGKEGLIGRITERDKRAFETWSADPANRQRLDMPAEAARYLCIPRRLLEVVKNPDSLSVLVYSHTKKKIQAKVFDRKVIRRAPHLWKASTVVEWNDKLNELERIYGKDWALLFISMEVQRDEILYEQSYFDHPLYRRKGVGKSFHERLREIAVTLEFRFITSGNVPKNIGFFRDALGRVVLRDVKPELRDDLWRSANPFRLDYFTIDFLNPQDREVFLQ